MKTLIVAATKAELADFYNYFNLPDEDFIEAENFDILITGVGMVATAFAIGKHVKPVYSLMLNLGIAGSFDRNINLGQVLEITEDTFAELGAQDGGSFLTIDELGFGKSTYRAKHPLKLGLPKVSAITVNKVTGNNERALNILSRLSVQTESMEGAAVFYASDMLGINCLQVRSISNYVEKRNKANWEIGPAIKNLNNWAIKFIRDMNKQ